MRKAIIRHRQLQDLLEYAPLTFASLAVPPMAVPRRFLRNEALRICHQGSEIARGIINFSSEELWEAQYDQRYSKRHPEPAKLVKHRVSAFQHLLCGDFKHAI